MFRQSEKLLHLLLNLGRSLLVGHPFSKRLWFSHHSPSSILSEFSSLGLLLSPELAFRLSSEGEVQFRRLRGEGSCAKSSILECVSPATSRFDPIQCPK